MAHTRVMRVEWRCIRCGEVIGLYEPAVIVDHNGVRKTSRGAESKPPGHGEAAYHLGCYEGTLVGAPRRQAA